MIENKFNAHKNAALNEGAQQAVDHILSASHCSVAESVQMILCFITEHKDGYMCQASVSYMQQILNAVCDSIEPELAIL